MVNEELLPQEDEERSREVIGRLSRDVPMCDLYIVQVPMYEGPSFHFAIFPYRTSRLKAHGLRRHRAAFDPNNSSTQVMMSLIIERVDSLSPFRKIPSCDSIPWEEGRKEQCFATLSRMQLTSFFAIFFKNPPVSMHTRESL